MRSKSEITTNYQLIFELVERPERVPEESLVVGIRAPPGPLGDIHGDRKCGSPHLARKTESLLGRKLSR